MIATYSECVFLALIISMQNACTVLSSVVCPAFQYICTLSHKRQDFWNTIEHNMCLDFIYNTFSEMFPNIMRFQRDSIRNVHRYSCKVPVILIGF